MNKRSWMLLAALGLLALFMAGCGGDDRDKDSAPGGTGAVPSATPVRTTEFSTPGAADVTGSPVSGSSFSVVTRNFAFSPPELTVPAGEPVTFNFSNQDAVPHTFTLYLDKAYTQAIPGGSATEHAPQISITFPSPGEYYFRCEVHPATMQGVLIAR